MLGLVREEKNYPLKLLQAGPRQSVSARTRRKEYMGLDAEGAGSRRAEHIVENWRVY